MTHTMLSAGESAYDAASTGSAVRQAARRYATYGWHIVPIANTPPAKPERIRTKQPIQPLQRAQGPLARLPRVWAELATTDVEQIEAWWDQWPEAMVGIATGTCSGVLVLHIDKPDDEAVNTKCAALPVTVMAQAGNVRDYYFQMPSGLSIHDQTESLPAGIHVRGDSQYVVVPPSVDTTGTRWHWTHSPHEIPLAQVPHPVLDELLGWPGCLPLDSSERMVEAKERYLYGAVDEVKQASRPSQTVILHLGPELCHAGLDMRSEAASIICEFVRQVAPYDTSKHKLTQHKALALLKQGYVSGPHHR